LDALGEFRRQFRYNQWANERTFAALGGESPIAARMGHLIGAETLWLARLEGTRSELAVWPVLGHEEARSLLAALGARWEAYLATRTAPDLDRDIRYVNSKGEPWSSRVHDVLVHVLYHAAYHRGQLAGDARAAGREPAYTDFIHYTRAVLAPGPR
jgi:uncharacterized damage-inducible protein DinB